MHRFHNWRDALQVAGSRRSVTRVMREYASKVPEDVRASLPEDCQFALTDPIDVQEAAVTLLRAELGPAGSGKDGEALHEIAHTFAAAALRFIVVPDVTRPPTFG